MIRIFGVERSFDPTDQYGEKFTSNGDIVVQPTKAIIHKAENSDFYLEIEASIEYLDYFQEGRIIVADVPWLSKPYTSEIFRIGNVTINHNKISSKCLHITYDLDWFIPNPGSVATGNVYVNYLLKQMYVVRTGAYGRYTCKIPDDTESICTGYFDITKTCFYYRQQSILATIKAFIDNDNLFFNRSRNTFYLTNERVETDTGITLEYGKNIQTFQKNENWNDVAHEIVTFPNPRYATKAAYECPDAYAYYPSGYDKDTFIKYTKFIKFKPRINASDYAHDYDYGNAAQADIEQQIDDYFKENGKPKINYTLNAYVDNVVDLGYSVKVKDHQMGVDVFASVLSFKYNLLTETYDEVTFGNYKESMKNYNYKVNTSINNLQDRTGSIAYPLGSIFTTGDLGQNPNSLSGFEGYWELQSSSGGIYTWKRLV